MAAAVCGAPLPALLVESFAVSLLLKAAPAVVSAAAKAIWADIKVVFLEFEKLESDRIFFSVV